MASIKKQYSFSNKRNIWRLIPSESDYLVIEERDLNTREVFFNCLKTYDGKVLFKNFQLDEKYWIGIETVYRDIIFFHKFRKPDMPGHKGIYAFDILNKQLIWQNDDLIFLFAKDAKFYAYQSTFEGRQYFVLDYLNGSILGEFTDVGEINKLREESMRSDFVNSFLIPQKFIKSDVVIDSKNTLKQLIDGRKIIGEVNWLKYNDYIMYNYHLTNQKGTLSNCFEVFDIAKNKIVLREVINSNLKSPVFESFFMIRDMLFLLTEKQRLVVYRIMQ
jgi:hypothetical protein